MWLVFGVRGCGFDAVEIKYGFLGCGVKCGYDLGCTVYVGFGLLV